jgi:acetylornithine aminotransferase
MPTYGRLDISFIKGEGAWLTDDQGRNYLDALSGIAVTGLGHAHPAIAKALAEQASTLIHTSNLYHIPLQQRLADKLCALSGMEQAFFCNSGAEANEAAIKIARKYGHSRGIDKPVVIVMDGSFHGRTMATLTATGNTKVQTGFEPLLPGFVRVPFNDLDALRMAISHWPEAVAVLVEPVQGEGGIKVPDSDYLTGVRQICTQRKLLMMLDEVQSGVGRTGKMFAYQHSENVIPDVLSLAKGLGNGVPVGACLVAGTATGILGPGNHGSTFGGNPLACCAALAVLETIENDDLLPRISELGDRIKNGFEAKLGDHAGIRDIRGSGLMIGIELTMPCAELVRQALDNGLLINVTASSVVRLLPPFILSDAEADKIVDDLSALILHFLDTHAVESVA